MRKRNLIVAVVALVLLIAACGGNSAEEELLEQILESGGEDIGDVEINTDGDGNVSMEIEGEDGETVNINTSGDGEDDVNISIEGEDGEDVTITGSGDDDEFTITVEGEDGGTVSIGGGEVPEGLTVPVPDGGDVVTSFTSGQDLSVVLVYPSANYDTLVSYYEAALLGDDAYKSSSEFEDDGETYRATSWIGDTYLVNVADCEGMESNTLDSVCVTINQFSS